MRSTVKVITITTAILWLSGCQINSHSEQIISPVNNDVGIVDQPPKIVTKDWQSIIQPLIDELLATMNVSANNTLLISDVNNRSDQYVSSLSVNNVISEALKQQTIFKIIDDKLVNQAKQQLGLNSDDSLVSRGKMLALARQLQSDYLLFTTINQVPELPEHSGNIAMELLLSKTGEIVWQFSSDQLVNYQDVN